MKTKLITIIATIAVLPLAGLAQTPPTPPNPPPGAPPPPNAPDRPERHEKKVPVTYLGVETSNVPRVLSEQLGLTRGFGIVVDYVVPDGPAAAAGVQQSDIIKMLNDQILTSPDQLSKLVRSFSEGTNVTLTILRKGKEEKVNVKLAKKEVPERQEFGPGRHWNDFHMGGMDFGDIGMGELNERMQDLKQQLGDEKRGMIHDTVIKAREEVMRAREQAMRARDDARRASGQIKITKNGDNGGLNTTKIDIGKAQIVFSDDKGELRVEKIDNKKVLTAKDPQGLLLFSGPVETKEDLDKVPAEVHQRYEKLQQHDLPGVVSSSDSENDEDSVDMNDEDDNNGDEVQSLEQV